MKKILLLIFMLVLFVTPCAFATDGNVYENQQYKFRITFPDGWQITENKGPIVEGRIPGKKFLVGVWKPTPINNDNQGDTIVNSFIERLQKKYPNAILAEKNHLQISNNAAIQFVVRIPNEDFYYNAYLLAGREYAFLTMGIGTPDHLDEDREAVRQIISTFTFID